MAGQLITIDDANYTQFLDHVDPDTGERKAKGLRPRNYATHPVGYLGKLAEPFSLPIIPESEWADRIAEQEAKQSSLQHIRDKGNNGQPIPSYDQDGKGYCWAHSSTSAVTLIRARENQPYVPLSAYMVACIIKGYRDQGGWGSESLEFIAKNGIPSAKFWPMQSMSRSNDNAEMRANAALHKVTEWWDCAEDGRTRRLQVATALLMGLPVISDFNWWSHSVCLIRLLSPTKTRLWNSWGDSWSQNGVGDLDGSKAWPDSAWVPRVMTPAPA
jgi:hypothetical protein